MFSEEVLTPAIGEIVLVYGADPQQPDPIPAVVTAVHSPLTVRLHPFDERARIFITLQHVSIAADHEAYWVWSERA